MLDTSEVLKAGRAEQGLDSEICLTLVSSYLLFLAATSRYEREGTTELLKARRADRRLSFPFPSPLLRSVPVDSTKARGSFPTLQKPSNTPAYLRLDEVPCGAYLKLMRTRVSIDVVGTLPVLSLMFSLLDELPHFLSNQAQSTFDSNSELNSPRNCDETEEEKDEPRAGEDERRELGRNDEDSQRLRS